MMQLIVDKYKDTAEDHIWLWTFWLMYADAIKCNNVDIYSYVYKI